METKKCSKCKIEKNVSEFYKIKIGKCGYRSSCKECHSGYRQKQEVRERRANAKLLRKYNITSEMYNNILLLQNNTCPICNIEFKISNTKLQRPCVDHCHTTNKVRGVLCGHCNQGIGMIKDNIETLKSAIKYLEKHNQ